ncbi:hypothetical protein Bca101_066563 [Brassica carinata]
MKPFNSNLKAKVMVKANEAETSDIDHLEVEKFSHKSNGVGAVEAAMLSLSEAAEKIDPSHLAACLDEVLNEGWLLPETQMLELIDYYGNGLSHVSFQWVNMFEEYPLSKLIDVPISLIPKPVYEKSIDFINTLPFDTLPAFVLWSSDLILTEWPGVIKVEQRNSNKSKVAIFVVLAMALRTQPDALTLVLTNMKERPTYQGQDKLPVIIWMMAQASQGDLSAGLFSWVQTLLPLVVNECCSSQAIDLILQFVEIVLTQNVDCFKQWDVLYKENLEASVALLNKLVDEWKDHSLILSSSSSDTLTVKHAMNSFRMKNEKAITEGVANPSLYKEADQSCKLISRRLSHGIGIAPLTAMVIAAAGGVVGAGAGAAHALIYLARSKKSS